MSLELKATVEWQPSASIQRLQRRAQILQQIRQFFAQRNVIEVETPLLSQRTVTDVHIDSFSVPTATRPYYLQTSPEYAMKRLLAAGSGCIYQISKAFRYCEQGQWHNPEFTLLEWYRVGFDHHQLMDEIEALLKSIGPWTHTQRVSYQQLFKQYCDIDIFSATIEDLMACLRQQPAQLVKPDTLSFDDCLQLLMSYHIESHLGRDVPLFVYDFPSSQAALAKLSTVNPKVASRFELYIHGMEIANGFDELTDATLQAKRWKDQQIERERRGLTVPALDQRLLAALSAGMPECAGVALGIDRLLLALASPGTTIEEVISFAWECA